MNFMLMVRSLTASFDGFRMSKTVSSFGILLLSAQLLALAAPTQRDVEEDLLGFAVATRHDNHFLPLSLRGKCYFGYCNKKTRPCCAGFFCDKFNRCREVCSTGSCGRSKPCCVGYFCASDGRCETGCSVRSCEKQHCCEGYKCKKRPWGKQCERPCRGRTCYHPDECCLSYYCSGRGLCKKIKD